MDPPPAPESFTLVSTNKKKKQNKSDKFFAQTKNKLQEHETLLAQLVIRLNDLTTQKDENTAHQNLDNEDFKEDVGPWIALSDCKTDQLI
jgi:hypothetical protein